MNEGLDRHICSNERDSFSGEKATSESGSGSELVKGAWMNTLGHLCAAHFGGMLYVLCEMFDCVGERLPAFLSYAGFNTSLSVLPSCYNSSVLFVFSVFYAEA